MWNIGDHAYSTDLHQLRWIIETQTLWGETLYRVWLPNQDTVVRVCADRLMPLQEAGTSSCDSITYVAAAAHVADALTHDGLLAPMGASVIPLPHQLQALSRAITNDRVRYLLADEVGLGTTMHVVLAAQAFNFPALPPECIACSSSDAHSDNNNAAAVVLP